MARSVTPLSIQLDEMDPKDVWTRYQKSHEDAIRNYLVEKYLHLVRYNAERICKRLPDEVDIDDLIQAGTFGLREAVASFDLERGVKFETYCAGRIKGAILDELRAMDWVPRLVRSRTNKLDWARQQIEMATGASATDEQIADMLGLDVSGEEFDKLKRDSKPTSISSINRRAYPGDGGREVRELDIVRDGDDDGPVSELQRRDLRELITKGLSRAERLIVVLYYYEGMTMKEIGATLDLSESRVSQMHSSILARLKAQMQHRMRELEPVE
jgi:RNA polymerase sigma factor for flagellar operon FliA